MSVATGSRGRVPVLTVAKAVDQGALFLGTLLVAGRIGPVAFAPLATLLVVNSLSVQLSDLGLGFAVHRAPLGSPLPGRSLRRVRAFGGLVVVSGGLIGAGVASPYPLLAGLIWACSAEAYVRTAESLRSRGPRIVLRAQVLGSGALLTGCVVSGLTERPELVGIALVAKHLTEVIALPTRWVVDPDGSTRSGREWVGQLATFAASNVDYVVVGLALRSAEYSIYLMAFRLVAAVPSVVAQALTQDAFVRLAAGGRDAAMALVRMATRRAVVIGVVAAAVGVGAAVAGEQLLGRAWSGVATTSLWLAVALPARLLLGSLVAVAVASGRSSSVIVHEIGRGVLTLVTTAVGVRWGLAGAALGASFGVGMGVLALRIDLARWLQPTRS